jgi:hypothetical protein
MLADCKLKVTVMDENTLTSHSLLGTGSISLRKLAPKINSPVELSIDLNEKGVSRGRLVVHATLREALPEEVVDTVDEALVTLKKGALTLKHVETIDIIGGDSSLLDGAQVCMITSYWVLSLCISLISSCLLTNHVLYYTVLYCIDVIVRTNMW